MAPTRWQQLGGLVYNADGLPGEAGRPLYEAGLRWIAVLVHEGGGLHERNLHPDQLARISAWRQAGIEVGAWGSWFWGGLDADTAKVGRERIGAPFYIGNPEAPYERSKGDYRRAADFEARAKQIGLKVDAITTYGRCRREELDWNTLKRVAKVLLPQAYGGPDGYFDLKWCMDECEPWWPAQTHPVLDVATPLGRPHGRYMAELADATQLGFKCLGVSVWVLERTAQEAIAQLGASPWVAR